MVNGKIDIIACKGRNNMMDLHLHSNYSDGSESMEEVVKRAKQAGLTTISFVDHDRQTNVAEARRLSELYEIQIISGIEISAYDFVRNRKVHILGYGYKNDAQHIAALCDTVLHRRQAHSLAQLEKIIAAGYDIQTKTVEKYAKQSGVIYKQHMMHALTDAPFQSEQYQSLYRSIFKGNGIAAGDITYVCAVDAVEAIVKDGGIAVLAHPGQLDSFELVPTLVSHGLRGIERNHFDHTSAHMEQVEELARTYHLFMTGGSDYHGIYGKEVTLGKWVSPSSIEKALV